MATPKYPEIKIQLTGKDSNAFYILGIISRTLRKAEVPDSVWKEFEKEATSGDYNHLLATAMDYFEIT